MNAAVQAILETAAAEAERDPAGLAPSLSAVAATADAIGHRPLSAVASGLADLARTLADPAQRVEPERIADRARLVQSSLAEPWCEAIATVLAAYARVAAASDRPEFRPVLVLALALAGRVAEADGRTELLTGLAGTAAWPGWVADDDPARIRRRPKRRTRAHARSMTWPPPTRWTW